MFDSHAHLDMSEFDADRESMIERAKTAGVDKILTVGIDTESSIAARSLAKQYAGLYAAAGCHPHNSSDFTTAEADTLAEIAASGQVVAWGEIGLDFYRNNSPRGAQQKAFNIQLERARELGLPVIIHNREAHEEVLNAVKFMGKKDRAGVIHCFSGNLALAHEFIALGYYISIPGTVTFSKADSIREVATGLSIENMLVETDAPFLAPVPKRGRRNEPAFVSYTVKTIARMKNMEPEEISLITSRNACELFGIPAI
ncbi:MAG: TatD family hydrolase [Desulfatiglandaceae bacterium]